MNASTQARQAIREVQGTPQEWGSMPIMRFISSNTNQLMPAAGATFARFGSMPCMTVTYRSSLVHQGLLVYRSALAIPRGRTSTLPCMQVLAAGHLRLDHYGAHLVEALDALLLHRLGQHIQHALVLQGFAAPALRLFRHKTSKIALQASVSIATCSGRFQLQPSCTLETTCSGCRTFGVLLVQTGEITRVKMSGPLDSWRSVTIGDNCLAGNTLTCILVRTSASGYEANWAMLLDIIPAPRIA
jgi:hypothetical protein